MHLKRLHETQALFSKKLIESQEKIKNKTSEMRDEEGRSI